MHSSPFHCRPEGSVSPRQSPVPGTHPAWHLRDVLGACGRRLREESISLILMVRLARWASPGQQGCACQADSLLRLWRLVRACGGVGAEKACRGSLRPAGAVRRSASCPERRWCAGVRRGGWEAAGCPDMRAAEGKAQSWDCLWSSDPQRCKGFERGDQRLPTCSSRRPKQTQHICRRNCCRAG